MSSWGFKGLVKSVANCREGFGKIIGRKNKISIGRDNWLKDRKPSFKTDQDVVNLGTKSVEDLMIPDSRVWNSHLIRSSFTMSSARAILSTHIPTEMGQNKLIWTRSENGEAIAKSVYNFLRTQQEEGMGTPLNVLFWKRLWGTKLAQMEGFRLENPQQSTDS